MNPERGHPVRATVTCIKGTCNAGHKVGDVMNVSARNTAGMCGYLYHAAHPAILMLQFGGSVPWGPADTVELQCPDTLNLLTLELQRLPADQQQGEPAGSDPVVPAAPVVPADPAAPAAEPPMRFGLVVCKVEEG